MLWDSRVWHGAKANNSGGTRWALIATYCRWWLKQAFDIPPNVPEAIYGSLTRKQRAILGFCSRPFGTEAEGVDMKQGYDSLVDSVSTYVAQRMA